MTEILNKKFWNFIIQSVVISSLLFGLIATTNYVIDASEVIRHTVNFQMAQLSLAGNTVTVPLNYNERHYQVAVVEEMKEIPETVVIGSSRGMFLGKEITGFDDLYNNCVSGACIEDYYALLGLYYQKYSSMPSRVIIETSPWVFYKDNPEARWLENAEYEVAARTFYTLLNSKEINDDLEQENPYLSLYYFQHNSAIFRQNGIDAIKKKKVMISTDLSEKAEHSDGTIRYESKLENKSKERLAKVKATNGAVAYENVDKMDGLDADNISEYEKLLDYLKKCETEIIIYMQPFSDTQCYYIFDEKANPIFEDVENYLINLGNERGIAIVGGYDARDFNISDEYFIDYMHLDKAGNKIVWDSSYKQ